MAWPKISKFWYVVGGGMASIALAVGLTACGSAPTTSSSDSSYTPAPVSPNAGRGMDAAMVTLPDGRTVICVRVTDTSGGPSCDWENAR